MNNSKTSRPTTSSVSALESYFGHIRTPDEAVIIFEACRLGLLPRIQRRLSERERPEIRSGSVFVWDEREAGLRRWTDGKSWSASRVSGSFLSYREMEGKRNQFSHASRKRRLAASLRAANGGSDVDAIQAPPDGYRYKPNGLIKQSFSLTTRDDRKLHLISYYSRATDGDDLPNPSTDVTLSNIAPPRRLYPETVFAEQSTERSPLSNHDGIWSLPPVLLPPVSQPAATARPPPMHYPSFAPHTGFYVPSGQPFPVYPPPPIGHNIWHPHPTLAPGPPGNKTTTPSPINVPTPSPFPPSIHTPVAFAYPHCAYAVHPYTLPNQNNAYVTYPYPYHHTPQRVHEFGQKEHQHNEQIRQVRQNAEKEESLAHAQHQQEQLQGGYSVREPVDYPKSVQHPLPACNTTRPFLPPMQDEHTRYSELLQHQSFPNSRSQSSDRQHATGRTGSNSAMNPSPPPPSAAQAGVLAAVNHATTPTAAAFANNTNGGPGSNIPSISVLLAPPMATNVASSSSSTTTVVAATASAGGGVSLDTAGSSSRDAQRPGVTANNEHDRSELQRLDKQSLKFTT